MATDQQPGLFGIQNSNRDLTKKEYWGKNQFNNGFPAALACYMHSKNLSPVYLTLKEDLTVHHGYIDTPTLFGIDCAISDTYFAFERDYVPYQRFVEGNLPRVDLVTMNSSGRSCFRGLEIKLTALPDQTTYNLPEDSYGCELVIRPDTIVYLGISIANAYSDRRDELRAILEPTCSQVTSWSSIRAVLPHIQDMVNALDRVLLSNLEDQSPLIIQPVWKTIGKSPRLAEDCLDTFVWSDFAFTRLFVDVAKRDTASETISRISRTAVWLVKMLYDFSVHGKIDHTKIIDSLSYNTKNDKAFSLPGSRTHPYMACEELKKPRITKYDIQHIILGGGERFLSPERRFDAVIVGAPGLFSD